MSSTSSERSTAPGSAAGDLDRVEGGDVVEGRVGGRLGARAVGARGVGEGHVGGVPVAGVLGRRDVDVGRLDLALRARGGGVVAPVAPTATARPEDQGDGGQQCSTTGPAQGGHAREGSRSTATGGQPPRARRASGWVRRRAWAAMPRSEPDQASNTPALDARRMQGQEPVPIRQRSRDGQAGGWRRRWFQRNGPMSFVQRSPPAPTNCVWPDPGVIRIWHGTDASLR